MTVHEAQTWLLGWLKSRGHAVVEDNKPYTSEDRRRDWSCKRKTRYDSKSEAAKVGQNMQHYKCEFCGGWHLATPRSG